MATRKLIVDGQNYEYLVGSSYVRIVDPKGTARVVSITDITGQTSAAFEEGKEEGTTEGMVKPSQVVAWIRSH